MEAPELRALPILLSRRFNRGLAIAVPVLILILAFVAGWWVAQRASAQADAELRSALLHRAVSVASRINPQLMRNLTFTAEDRTTPGFLRITGQMKTEAAAHPEVRIISMAIRNDSVVMGPASHPVAVHGKGQSEDPAPHPSLVRAVHATGRPQLYGPGPDSPGVFAAALAPVMGEGADSVVAVVGVAVTASARQSSMDTWQWVVFLSGGIFGIVLFFLVRSGFRRFRLRFSRDIRVRLWIMLPTAVAIGTAIVIRTAYQYTDQEEFARERRVQMRERVHLEITRLLSSHVRILRMQLRDLAGNPTLSTVWSTTDRADIRAIGGRSYEYMRRMSGVDQLTFMIPDRTCLYRAHQPELHGDRIARSVPLVAEWTGEDAWGIELGSRGDVTLRYVMPVREEGRITGFVEAAKDVGTLIERLAADAGIDIITVLRKEYISRENAEAGRAAEFIAGEWDSYPSALIIRSTGRTLPPVVDTYLREEFHDRTARREFEAHAGRLVYACGVVSVPDVFGRDAVVLVSLQDVTAEHDAAFGSLLLTTVLVTSMLGVVLIILWTVTGEVEKRLVESFEGFRVSEERYDQLARQSGTVTWEVDRNGLFTYVSGVSTAVYGYPPEEIVGKLCFYDMHPEEGREAFRQAALSAFEQRLEFKRLENEILRKDGRVIWVETNGIPVLGSDGSLTGYQGSDTDITDRKRAEESLRESESRMRAITTSAQDAIVMMDPQGRISFWNPAAEQLFGYTAGEAVGSHLHRLLSPGRYHAAHHRAYPAFQEQGTGAAIGRTLDLEALRKDGSEVSIQLSLSAVQLKDGWHAIGLLRDVTERKLAEAQREATLAELGDALDDLREANRLLEETTERANAFADQASEANRAKSQFLASMSHEIRTPMNGVIGMIGLLLDTPLTPEQRQFAHVVRTSSEALLSLINDILDFSKIEAGKIDMETLDFDLASLLDDTIELLSVRAHEKGLGLVSLLHPDVPHMLRGDPGRLRQVLLNLGGNALKFTHRGGVTIRTVLAAREDAQLTLRFEVTDTGIGIPPDKQDRLFAPFTQVDGSHARKYGGTGLGLAISRQLVGLMGGQIGVISPAVEDNQAAGHGGSTFWFTITLAPATAGAVEPQDPAASFRGVRVLVVDDVEANRMVLTSLLSLWGARPEVVPDGEQALRMLAAAAQADDPFRVALIDMLMTGMDGAELGRRIRSNPSWDGLSMVLLTSVGDRGDPARMGEIGFSAVIRKPIRQSALQQTLVEILKGAVPALQTESAGPERARPQAPPEVRKGRILVAEDNPINQLVAMKMLAKLGYRPDMVANGEEAIAAVSSIPYDLVLMDCQMPEVDGFEATRVIRASNNRIPIVAMTANAMKGDREACIAAGMSDYLSKPVKAAELEQMIRRWLAGEDAEEKAPFG